jgi:hypothetical protein
LNRKRKSQIDGFSEFAHALGSGYIVAVAGGRERIGARRAFCPRLVTVVARAAFGAPQMSISASRRADCCSAEMGHSVWPPRIPRSALVF